MGRRTLTDGGGWVVHRASLGLKDFAAIPLPQC